MLVTLLAAGCGSGDPAGTPAKTCADLAAACFANQQGCAETGGVPSCQACPAGTYATAAAVCDPIGGTPMAHTFADFTTMAGEEILGLCQSWTLDNAGELWVNAVQLDQNASSHHSNWTFVPDDDFVGPDGVWMCKDRNYSQLTAALDGGVLYAQSTQATHEVQKFPNGAAVRIPPYSRIIGDVHILNVTPQPVTGHSTLTIYTLPVEEVKVKLAPFHMTYDGLDIPAHAESRFTGDCNLDSKFHDVDGSNFNLKLYYALPHTHAMATRFFFEISGGPRDGEPLIDVGAFNGEARGRAYDVPVDLTGAKGLRFGCEYTNPRSENVKWGFGDQEMCEMLGFADSKIAFESTVATADPAGTDGARQLFTGACSTLAFTWDNNKMGGPGPM
jgi:hypothetical protein